MSTQIDLLASLQEIDRRLRQKEFTLQELRQQVTTLIAAVETKEREAETLQQRITELEAQHRTTESQLKEEEGKLKEKRARQNRIRNERELLAVRREIEIMKEAHGKLEEGGIRLLDQLEQEKTRLAQTQAQIAELKDKLEKEKAEVETQIIRLEGETQQERKERETVARNVDADLCARYERIFAKRSGLAVVEIRSGTCQGCHMHIPPHMGNQIRSNIAQNTGAIFQCPHCGRILYWRMTPEGSTNA